MDKGAKIIKFESLQKKAIEKQKKEVKKSIINKRIKDLKEVIDDKLMDLHTLMERQEE